MYNVEQSMLVYMYHCIYTLFSHTAVFYIIMNPGCITSFLLRGPLCLQFFKSDILSVNVLSRC